MKRLSAGNADGGKNSKLSQETTEMTARALLISLQLYQAPSPLPQVSPVTLTLGQEVEQSELSRCHKHSYSSDSLFILFFFYYFSLDLPLFLFTFLSSFIPSSTHVQAHGFDTQVH